MDWSLPTISGTSYTNWNTQLKDRDIDLFRMGDPNTVAVAITNAPTNAIRWNSTNNFWEKFNGSVWNPLSSLYAIAVSGNSGTATKWATARSITLSGAVTGSQSFDGSANFTVTTTYTTVPVDKGGTNLTSYAVGDILYASGTTTLAKLSDVATGNALISGGVGVAPSWGKIGLTTHVSGTLPLANGGTNATDASGARTQLGVVIGTNVQAFHAQLSALAALAANGLIARTGTNTVASRTLTGETNRITVTNGDGVSGNPTLTIGTEIAKQKTQTLTDAATINWNMANGNIAQVTLGGNRTLANPTNVEAGGSGFLDVIQDGTGNRTLAFGTNYRFVAAVDPVITTTAGARDRLYWSSFDGTIIDITQTVDMRT